MAVETDADRAVFVNGDEFGQAVTWTKKGGVAVQFSAIFDSEYRLLTSALLEEGAEGSAPVLLCRSSDLPAGAANDDSVQVAGASYRVIEIRPDGTGMCEVRLMEA